MGVVRGAHGNELGDFFHRSGGAPERLMAAYLTWRGILLPRSLVLLPLPGTYGNVAVATMMAGGARHHSSSTSSQRTATITTPPPQLRATAATRATNVRALAPSGVSAPQSPTASKSSGSSTSAPRAAVNSPHRPQATDATLTAGIPAPSGAGTPQSPHQESSSKRAAQRHQPQQHAATEIPEHRASPAGRGTMPSPTNTAAAGTRPEQPLGTVHLQTSPGPGFKGDPAPQPQTAPEASTPGRQPAACQAAGTQAHPEPHPHHSPQIWPTEVPRHAPSEGPPTKTCTATPTDATNARPLGTVRPHAHNPTESPSPQGPATPSTSAPRCHLPAPAQTEPASQQHHDPPAGPAVRPTETPSGNRPAPKPGPGPRPGFGGGTPAAKPASAEGTGGTRALAGHVGGQPGMTPVPESQTREAVQPTGGAATPPAPPAQPQREEPTVDTTEDTGGPPQRKEEPPPAADLPARAPPQAEIPNGGAGQPGNQRASSPDMAAGRSVEAADAGQPGTGPGGPTPDAAHAVGLLPPTAQGAQPAAHAGAAPFTAPAHRRDADAPGNAASGRRHHGAHLEPTRSPKPGHHTGHAQARGRQANIAWRTRPHRRLF